LPELEEKGPKSSSSTSSHGGCLKPNLLHQASPARAAAHRVHPKTWWAHPPSPQPPMAIPMSFTSIYGHHNHGCGRAHHSPCMSHPSLVEASSHH
jgi:hypothetical protein